LSHVPQAGLVNCITDRAGLVVSRSDGAAVSNFLPRIECAAQQHGFRRFAEVAALFRPGELGYVT
jgi:hypothetical protein